MTEHRSNDTKRGGGYRDFAQASEEEVLREMGEAPQDDEKRYAGVQTFPQKLHYMLEQMECDGKTHIISWQPHGRSFAVHDRFKLETELLPM